MSTFSFDPLIPPSLWLALALVSAALLMWYTSRRPGVVSPVRWGVMIALMACGTALVLGILLNPTWMREVAPPPGKPLLTLLVDCSASMSTPDAERGSTRYSAAALQAMELADALKGQFDVRVRTFAGAASAAGVEDLPVRTPAGESTDLATALLASLDEQRPQGQAVVLLSDGIHNAGGGATNVLNATRLARAGATPVYTRTFGGQASGFDMALELRSSQDLAIIDQKVPITARISHHGINAGLARVVLLQDDKEIARREAQLMPGAPADVHFVIGQEKVGVYRYEVRLEPQQGEKTQANNSASYVLRVVDEPIRVLVLEGKPYWDSKFFLRTLATDPAVALDSVVRITDTRFMRRTLSSKEKTSAADKAKTDKAQAERLETWKIVNDASSILEDYNGIKPYQVVVLGRDAEAFLTETAVQNLTNWISRDGGSLVCYRGSPAAEVNQRMAKLLPVRWSPAAESRFRVKLTDQGRDMQWLGAEATEASAMLASMPPLATRTKIVQPKPLAVVLATSAGASGREAPAVVYQPYGGGRVVVIEGAGMWRWAFLPPQFQDHEQVYAALWPSLLRWLTSASGQAPGQEMTLRADKVRFATSEAATATLLARKEIPRGQLPNIELSADVAGAAPKAFAPATIGDEVGVFRVNFGKLPAGRYLIRIAGAAEEDAAAKAMFDVRAFGEEELNLEARPDLMARIASDSDGAVITAGSADEIQAKFKEHFVRTRPPRIERAIAWDRWWVLAGVVGVWGLSWAIRRSGGLV